MEINIKKLRCYKCDKRWIPRYERVDVCPRCHSTRWDIPTNSKSKRWVKNEA